jgi:hypothetical protein
MGFGKLIQRKLLAAPGGEAKQQAEDLGAQSDQDDDYSLLPAGVDTAEGVSSSCAGCSELSGDGRSMHSSSGSSSSGGSSDCGREDEVRLVGSLQERHQQQEMTLFDPPVMLRDLVQLA